MSRRAFRVDRGSPYPLGATADADGVNFALYAANADARRALPVRRRRQARDRRASPLPEFTDEVWHGYVHGRRARASSTAIACTGPTRRRTGTASTRNKLLIDPYARLLRGELDWNDAHFGYRARRSRDADLSFNDATARRSCPNAW